LKDFRAAMKERHYRGAVFEGCVSYALVECNMLMSLNYHRWICGISH